MAGIGTASMRTLLHDKLPYLFDIVAQGTKPCSVFPRLAFSRQFTLAFFCCLLARACTFLCLGSPGLGVSCMRMLEIYGVGLAVATIAYASQSSLLTHRDSPIAVILFATTSILLFTLPRVGGDSRIPHIVALLFGFTTILGYLFGTSPVRSIPS